MSQKIEKTLFYFLLFASFIAVAVINLTGNSTFDAGDGIQHYFIARYAWNHPQLFLDMWGKPFFTLISSPFAQFGLRGMFLFQSLCALGVSFFCYKIADKLNFKYAWAVPVFVFFSPIYFAVINTGLTEIFFGFLLMLSVWLIFEKRFIMSAFVFSFIPFVRPEAYFILPLIILLLVVRKKFTALPFLLFAFVLYTIIGYFYYHDILWIKTHNYKAAENYVGNKGSFFHFINHYDEIWGVVYSVLLIIGIGLVLYTVAKTAIKKTKQEFMSEELLLILGVFFCCLILHSALFSVPGILNNLGMMCYMTTLIPCSAILAVKGLNIISFSKIKKHFYIELPIIILLLFFIIKTPFQQWFYPFHLSNEQIVLNEVGKWINSNTKNNKIVYLHPYIPVAVELDPFNTQKSILFWSLDKCPVHLLPDSSFIIWDSHYLLQEGGVPLTALFEDTNLTPLKHSKYGDNTFPFETWVFMKTNSSRKLYKSIATENVTLEGIQIDSTFFVDTKLSKIDSSFFNFDTSLPDDISTESKNMLSTQKALSEKTSLAYLPNNEFGPLFSKKINTFKNYSKLKTVEVSFNFFPCDSIKNIVLAIEIRDSLQKTVAWYGAAINEPIKFNAWNAYTFHQDLQKSNLKGNYSINFYIWNQGKRKFYIDDVAIYYYSL